MLSQHFIDSYPVFLGLQKTDENNYDSYALSLQGLTVQDTAIEIKSVQLFSDTNVFKIFGE